jgi:uncharacterized protein (DUF1800 family)
MKSKFSFFQRFTAFLMLAAMLAPVLAVITNAQQMSNVKAKALTEDQKILHVLNRLGFGARPGDVEKVKAIGLNKYIEQQLNPVSLDDSLAESKVKNFDVLKMSNEEIFAKYPNGQVVLQMVGRMNGLDKGDIAELRKKNQVKGVNDAPMPKDDGAMMKPDDKTKNVDPAQMTDAERQKFQQEVNEIYQKYNLGRPQQISQQLAASRVIRAVYSEKQLQEVMVDFWTNHFNVYANKAAVRWLLPEYDRDIIRPNALGNFKDLLLATAKSPAMLFYLDNFQSVAPNAQANNRGKAGNGVLKPKQLERAMDNPQVRERIKKQFGLTDAQIDERMKQMRENPQMAQQQVQQLQQRQQRGINENYAREIMELHTLGVDGGYTQKDIQEVARAFTGWTIIDPRGYRKAAAAEIRGMEDKRQNRMARQMGLPQDAESGTFYFNERWHDDDEKVVLGQKITEGGMNDGLKVLDILANHPSTAKFIAKKLAIKFVSDNPSEALVGRVADAFLQSKGDIKTTLRALFTDKEFYAPENYRAKIKTPFELVVSAVRIIGAETNGGQIQAMLNKMGEPLYGYQAPTGYPDMAEDWVNTGALLERINFAIALASNRIPGTRVNLSAFAAQNKQEILNKSVASILGGEISPNTKATLLKQLDQPLPEPKMDNNVADRMAMENAAMERPNGQQIGGGRRNGGGQARLLPPSGNPEIFKVVGLIIGSPDFQRQ